MGALHQRYRLAVPPALTATQRRGARLAAVARPDPPTHTGAFRTMNDQHPNQDRAEFIDEQIERQEMDKIRLETQLIEATMRRDRFAKPSPFPRISSGSMRTAARSIALPKVEVD